MGPATRGACGMFFAALGGGLLTIVAMSAARLLPPPPCPPEIREAIRVEERAAADRGLQEANR